MRRLTRLLARLPGRRPKPSPRMIERLAQSPGRIDGILHLLFDDAPAGLVAIDRRGRIVRANAVLPGLVGEGVDVSPGTQVELIFAEEARAAAAAEIAPILAGRDAATQGFDTRLRGAAPDGDVVHVSAAALREADGTVSGGLLRLSDITRQRQLETQLAQSQKLQAVGQLAGGIAHDFNNLLTAVLGAADSIAAHDGLCAEIRDDAAQISASAQRGAALVRQLLAFGRQQTLQPRVVAVNTAIDDLSLLLRRLLASQVRLELDLEPASLAARVDPTQLDQVMVNLAVNASDAMPDGGVLTLRTSHTTLYRELDRGPERIPPGRYVIIEVRDTGEGIPADILPRIFDPFFTTRRGAGGSGLGLSTVHGIVRQSDGYISVESQPGIGTRMRVYLPRWDGKIPIAIPQFPTAPAPAPMAPSTCSGRIALLVDDEAAVRNLAERMLLRHGWRVLAAENAEHALDLVATATPTVIVTDMVMPGMDGAALISEIRARLNAPMLPAVLVSGYAEAAIRADIGAAATVFLPKPYSLRELVGRLDGIVGVK